MTPSPSPPQHPGGGGSARADWLIMQRDVGDAVPVHESKTSISTVILDMNTSAILAAQVGETESESLVSALGSAIASDAGLHPGAPGVIYCPRDLVRSVRLHLAVINADEPVVIQETTPSDEAEDTFDHVVSLLLGVAPQLPIPHPDDTRMLYGLALRLLLAAPWNSWNDEERLVVVARVGDECNTMTAIVLGAEGVQQGLVIGSPSTADDGHVRIDAEGRGDVAPGTLLLHFEHAVPPPFRERAYRYGWPSSAPVIPLIAVAGEKGRCTLDASQTRRFLVALQGVVDAADKHRTTGAVIPVQGSIALADGSRAEYEVQGNGARNQTLRTGVTGKAAE